VNFAELAAALAAAHDSALADADAAETEYPAAAYDLAFRRAISCFPPFMARATNPKNRSHQMNIIAILSSACADAGLDPLAWGSISVADLIAARGGREGATPASVSPEAQIAYERGLRLAAETRVAVLEEMLAMQGEREEFEGDADADDDEPGEFAADAEAES
jgi:hypothetical protein